MKKLIVLTVIFLMAISVTALAANTLATLINTSGDKVVVAAGSSVAQSYFNKGYVLMGSPYKPQAPQDCSCVGVVAGPDHYNTETFHAGFGGVVLATSTASTATFLRAADLAKYSVFYVTPTAAALTYTLPATSTMGTLLRNEGDTKRWVFINATSTVAATLTLAKGVGWDLTGVDANVDVIAGAAAGSYVNMAVDCTKGPKTSTTFDITCQLTENIAVD